MPSIFFDYDGTLHDTMRIYGPAFRTGYESLLRAGWVKPREFSDEWISHWLGWTIHDMWSTFLPNLPEAVWRPAAHLVGQEMERLLDEGHGKLFEGVPEMLDSLVEQGYTLVLLSNCASSYCRRHRARFGLDRWFSGYSISGEHPGLSKAQYFALDAPKYPSPALVVGDRFHDIEAATLAGIPSIGCAYGFGLPGELDTASERVASASEIPAAVRRLLA